jgi:hypothetical protein
MARQRHGYPGKPALHRRGPMYRDANGMQGSGNRHGRI